MGVQMRDRGGNAFGSQPVDLPQLWWSFLTDVRQQCFAYDLAHEMVKDGITKWTLGLLPEFGRLRLFF
jgi:hypothetical protein